MFHVFLGPGRDLPRRPKAADQRCRNEEKISKPGHLKKSIATLILVVLYAHRIHDNNMFY